jgi:hypothetical protein
MKETGMENEPTHEQKKADRITSDMCVAAILRRWPETYDVFRRNGCPDMRRGVFALTARVMKLAWAARVHGISMDKLLAELNAVVTTDPRR